MLNPTNVLLVIMIVLLAVCAFSGPVWWGWPAAYSVTSGGVAFALLIVLIAMLLTKLP